MPVTPGKYLGTIFKRGYERSTKSEAMAYTMRVMLEEHLDDDGTTTPLDGKHEMDAYVWVVRGDGTENELGDEGLRQATGWDGSFEQWIENDNWKPTRVQVTVGEDEYKGVTRLKIQWVERIGGKDIFAKKSESAAEKFKRDLAAAKERSKDINRQAKADAEPPAKAGPEEVPF
jgi:hypothetical protein